MKAASRAVSAFGASAASRIGKSPVGTGAKFVSDWGKAFKVIGEDAARMFRGSALGHGTKFITDWGKAIGAMHGDKIGMLGKGFVSAASGAARFGAAVGRIGISAAVGGFRLMGNAIDTVYATTKQTVGQLATLGAVAAVGIGYGIGKVVNSAADLGEAMNLAKIQFGADSGYIIKQAEMMSGAVGDSKKSFIETAGAIGGVLGNSGLSAKAIAETSVMLTKLAGDVDSAYNYMNHEGSQKIISSLGGEIEPLRRIGVMIDDNAVKAQAYAMGLAKAGEEVSQEAKVQARIPLIQQGLNKIMQDRLNTSDEVKNKMREVQGRVENLSETIGAILQPVTKSALTDMATGLGALQMLWVNNQDQVAAWAGATLGGSQTAAEGIGFVQQAVMSLANAWQSVQSNFLSAQLSITKGMIWMLRNLPGLSEGLNRISGGAVGVSLEHNGEQVAGLGNPDRKPMNDDEFKASIIGDLEKIGKSQATALAEAMGKGPLSVSVAEQFAAAKAKADALKGELMGTPTVIPPTVGHGLAPVEDPDKKHKKQDIYAGGFELGSKEAYSAIAQAKASMSGTGGKVQDKIEANTREAAVQAKASVDGIQKLVSAFIQGSGSLIYQATAGI